MSRARALRAERPPLPAAPVSRIRRQISAQLASISTQNVDGSAVTVPETSISGTEGWVAVYGEEFGGGQPTPELVGYAPIQEGQNANVEVFPWRGP
jgi:hypothetical protein